MRPPPNALLITRADIERMMTQTDWLEAAERAFRAAANRKATSPHPMHIPASRGGFHVKAASISGERHYVAVKVNGNFRANPRDNGLPTVQGAIILADGRDGVLLAIMDSIEVTLRRTAAASALAAKLLARPDSSTMLVCGCGAQAGPHVDAVRNILPLTRLLFWDRAMEAAEALALDVNGEAVDDLKAASLSADVIVCCTSAIEPFLHAEMVRPGTFIAAVGADNPEKSEISPELMAGSIVVADSRTQCADMGDLRHAIAAGSMTESDVYSELADVVALTCAGRRSTDDTIIFDSTGTALLDVAACASIYEHACRDGLGQAVPLGTSTAKHA